MNLMNVDKAVIQKDIHSNPKFNIKGAQFTDGHTVFKIHKGHVYYYHASQKKWFKSLMFNTSDMKDLYTVKNPH